MPTTGYVSGPAKSPRLGRVLKLNVLGDSPVTCSFSCADCRAETTRPQPEQRWPSPDHPAAQFDAALTRETSIPAVVLKC